MVQVGYLKLPQYFQQIQLLALGYELDEHYIASTLVPQILNAVPLGNDLVVRILDAREQIPYLQESLPASKYLVAENFSEGFPDWKLAMFHREGKTIEELIGKEKRIYLGFFIGVLLVIVVGVVVTVRAAAHELELSRMKSEFVSNVSHELKTPLALIRMFGETLESGLVTNEVKRQEFYHIITKESERLTHLINNVLDFSKMDAGAKKYNFEEEDIVEVVKSTLEAYKFHIRDLGFEMVSQLPPEPVITRIDQDAISQALLNLLSNATNYSEDRKFLRVGVTKNSNSVLISVEDSGVGIPKQEIRKIFDKFYQVRPRKDGDWHGSGLGLTLVKNIVEAHGGAIEVKSVEGAGSTFTLTIPLHSLKEC